MAKYTVELNEIVNNGVNIFNFDYPLYDAAHKNELEDKIKRHYWFREIGVETVGRFIYNLKTLMNEIMPKYNKLYAAIAANPINVMSNSRNTVTDTGKQTTENLNSSEMNDNGENHDTGDTTTHGTSGTVDAKAGKVIENDTPQGLTELVDSENGVHASKVINTSENNTSNVTNDGTVHTQNDGTRKSTVKTQGSGSVKTDNNKTVQSGGYNGITESELLNTFAKNYTDVDIMIIAELNDLFMGVY